MPGAYEKQMHGEHYELISNTVQKCCEFLEDEKYELLRLELPMLLLLQGDRSKKTIEEFCYAGGFKLMCRILQLRGGIKGSLIGDVTPILNNFSSLLSIEFDPFDDDLGTIPLLTYFLCERHTHYVDIQWNSESLMLMKEFIVGHLSIIASVETINESDRVLAVNNLYGALLSYPPHRVVKSAASVFTPETCSTLLTSLRQLPSMWNSASGRRRIMQLLLATASFGLGLVITADIPHSQLLMTMNRQLVPELRCPCGRCEFFRRLQRVAKERDEFGVAKASEAKKAICYSFVKSGIHQFVADLLNEVQSSFSKNKSRPQLNESILSTTAAAQPSDENVAPVEMSTTNHAEKSTGDAKQECVEGMNKDSSSLSTGYELIEAPVSDLKCRLRRQEDLLVERICDNDDPRLDDQSKLLTMQVIWLCSWACEEMYECSILSTNDLLLATTLLKSLDLSDLRFTFNPTTGEFLPGVRATIETLCGLTLKTENEELKSLTSRLRPTIEALLQRCCTQLVESCGPLSRHWKPSMSIFAPVLSVMLTCVYIAASNDSTSRTPTTRRHRTTTTTRILSVPLITSCTDATRSLVDGYEWGGCQIDERIFIESLLQSMAVLTGRLEYSRCSEARRRLLPPPDASCGFMASAGRWLLNKFDSSVANGEGCVIIRTLGSVIISSAEKAVALQLPTTEETTTCESKHHHLTSLNNSADRPDPSV